MSSRTVVILGLLGFAVAGASAQDQNVGNVGNVSDGAAQAVADRGPGLHYGPLQVLPELDVSYFHDSNPTYREDKPKGVNGIRTEPILNLLLDCNGWNAYLKGWYAQDSYFGLNKAEKAETDTLTDSHYGESAGINYKTPLDTVLSLTEDYDYESGNSYAPGSAKALQANGDRYTLDVGASVATRLSEKTGVHAGVSYYDLWYANSAAGLYGRQDEGATLGLSEKVSEKSDLLLDFGFDNQSSDSPGIGDSQSYRGLVGFGSQLTAKTSYKAEVGYLVYNYNDSAKTAYAPTYQLSGKWDVSEQLSAHVAGSADFQPAEDAAGNYTLIDTVSAGLSFKATSRLTTTLDAIYRRENYEQAIAGQSRLDNNIDLAGRATYQLFRYTSVFVGADFGKTDSSFPGNSYNRLYLDAGVQLHF